MLDLTLKSSRLIRIEKYQNEVLRLLVELFYTATYTPVAGGMNATFKTATLNEAKAKIDAIRAQFSDGV